MARNLGGKNWLGLLTRIKMGALGSIDNDLGPVKSVHRITSQKINQMEINNAERRVIEYQMIIAQKQRALTEVYFQRRQVQ
jgi:hypothetical protein